MENKVFLQIGLFCNVSRPQLLSLYNDVVLCTASLHQSKAVNSVMIWVSGHCNSNNKLQYIQ